jgi:hypothetical protein
MDEIVFLIYFLDSQSMALAIIVYATCPACLKGF